MNQETAKDRAKRVVNTIVPILERVADADNEVLQRVLEDMIKPLGQEITAAEMVWYNQLELSKMRVLELENVLYDVRSQLVDMVYNEAAKCTSCGVKRGEEHAKTCQMVAVLGTIQTIDV